MQTSFNATVAANTVSFTLRDTNLEQSPGLGFFDIFGRADTATGAIELDGYRVGMTAEQTFQRIPVNVGAAGSNPNNTDDYLGGWEVFPGQKQRLEAREVNGVNTPLRLRMVFTPLGQKRPGTS